MGSLHRLSDLGDDIATVGAEEAGEGHAELGVARGVGGVTTDAAGGRGRGRIEEVIAPRLLIRRERVVERADGGSADT